MSKNSKSNTPNPLQSQAQQQPLSTITSNQPTDAYIPPYLFDLVPSLREFEELKDAERKLDIYLARKRIDLHQSVSQWNNSKSANQRINNTQYLRVFVSNVSENQPWQINNDTSADNNDNLGPASWTMRIEGRLINDQDINDPKRPKFSSFIQAIAVDFKKIPTPKDNSNLKDSDDVDMIGNEDNTNNNNSSSINGNSNGSSLNLTLPLQLPTQTNDTGKNNSGNIQNQNSQNGQSTMNANESVITDAVEWQFDPKNNVEFDGLDIKRNGNENLDCSITIQLKNSTASQLIFSPELASIIGIRKGSMHDAVYSLFKYILINDLLINDENEISKDFHSMNSSNSSNTNDNKTNNEKTLVQINDDIMNLLPNTFPQKKTDLNSMNNNSQIEKDNDSNNTEQSTQSKPKKLTIKLVELLPLVNNHVIPLPPIKLNYKVRVDKASTYGEVVFDVEVPMSNKNIPKSDLSQSGMSLLGEFNKLSNEAKPKLLSLDSEISALQLQLNASASRYQFFNKLSQDPVPILQDYIASTANALKVLSADEGYNEDMVRRAQFYSDNEDTLFESLSTLLANGRM